MTQRPILARVAGKSRYYAQSLASKIRVYSNYDSFRIHNQLLACSPKLREEELYAIRVRELDGNLVYCRPATTDINVFDDTFFGRYHLPPRDLIGINTILDLGSNIGLTVAHFAAIFPQARILGVELDRENHEVCQRNVEPFRSRCNVIHGAVWTSDGEVGYGGTESWGYSVVENSTRDRLVRSYRMPALLDLLTSSVVDYVKMDIEGAEAKVLEDASDWIDRVRCLKVEIHQPYTVDACILHLQRHGMTCYRDTRHRACVVAWNGLLSNSRLGRPVR